MMRTSEPWHAFPNRKEKESKMRGKETVGDERREEGIVGGGEWRCRRQD